MFQRWMIRYFLFFCLLTPAWLSATHNRAGEITYRHIAGLTYEVTITTYTKESSVAADRCSLTVSWGDNTTSVLNRINGPTGLSCGPGIGMGVSLVDANDVKLNIYRGTHTYPSAGIYIISMEDPNRNGGVSNIPGSISVPFYIQTTLVINPILGPNNSVQLLNPPIDDACLNQPYIHNPGAFDPDGDSLVFTLVNCRGAGGIEFQTTYAPNLVQDPVNINPLTGDLEWNVPKNVGQYNFAIMISEFRKTPNGQYSLISQVTRDLQITVGQCSNQPPVIPPVGPFCVVAGETLTFSAIAFDPDHRNVTLTATGGPFIIPPTAVMMGAPTDSSSVTRTFRWTTACNHVRQQPYQVFFRAVDQPLTPFENPLSTYMTAEIQVIGPPPSNLQAVGSIGKIELSWDLYLCADQIRGFKIFRKEGPSGFSPDSCQTGIPEWAGFEEIGYATGSATTSFVDSTIPKMGVIYCYRIVADYQNGAESIASAEACSELARTGPILTNADVTETSETTGRIDIKWIRPQELDTNLYPPPYSYKLLRAEGISGNNFTEISSFASLTDTSYTDTLLNTSGIIYRYRVDFLSGPSQTVVNRSYPATQPFLKTIPSNRAIRLTYDFDGPWNNDTLVAYRQNPNTLQFDSIGFSTESSFLDTGLQNGTPYCYYLKTIGNFSGSNMPTHLINRSQIVCDIPADTALPCPPMVAADYICENRLLEFALTFNDTGLCMQDLTLLYYNLYYKKRKSEDFPDEPAMTMITSPSLLLEKMTLAGCYAFTAVTINPFDPQQIPKESRLSAPICLPSCPDIKLPNVFTPNGDGTNDIFLPIRWIDILDGKISIFNRWGQLVYEADAAQFSEAGWDGKDQFTNKLCSDGTYFYVISVMFLSDDDQPKSFDFKGSVTLFR